MRIINNNFIKTHLIKEIKKMCNLIYKTNNYKGFIWLDEPVYDDKNRINRIGTDMSCSQIEYYVYLEEEVLPTSWYLLSPKTIYDIYKKLKNNEVKIHIINSDYNFKIRPNVYIELE